MTPIFEAQIPVCFRNTDAWLDNLRITYDEFLCYKELSVEKIRTQSKKHEVSNVERAVKSMRKHGSATSAQSYIIYLSENEDLYKYFKPPSYVLERDLYINYWTQAYMPTYLKRRNRMFVGYNKHYQSPPQTTYGGVSEWLYVISGHLKVHTYKPTKLNLLMSNQWECKQDPSPAPEICQYTLQKNCCLIIPAGWITDRKAMVDTFALNGEFINIDDIDNQLEMFQRDVQRTANTHSVDRDSNIRSLYWIFVARLLQSGCKDNTLNSINIDTYESLKRNMMEWRKLSAHDNHPELYVPPGMRSDSLVRDLRSYTLKGTLPRNNRISKIRQRRKPKSQS